MEENTKQNTDGTLKKNLQQIYFYMTKEWIFF